MGLNRKRVLCHILPIIDFVFDVHFTWIIASLGGVLFNKYNYFLTSHSVSSSKYSNARRILICSL